MGSELVPLTGKCAIAGMLVVMDTVGLKEAVKYLHPNDPTSVRDVIEVSTKLLSSLSKLDMCGSVKESMKDAENLITKLLESVSKGDYDTAKRLANDIYDKIML